jgi:hypothetical protein
MPSLRGTKLSTGILHLLSSGMQFIVACRWLVLPFNPENRISTFHQYIGKLILVWVLSMGEETTTY